MDERPLKVLLVEDPKLRTEEFADRLCGSGDFCVKRVSRDQALEIMSTSTPDLVLTGWDLPSQQGLGLAERLRAMRRLMGGPMVLLHASTAEDMPTPRPGMDRKRLERMVQERTRALNSAVESALGHQQRAMAANLDSLHRLASAAEFKDNETAAHIQRMSVYAALLAEALGLAAEEVEQVHQASPMHDVGKIGVPDNILLKPGPLDSDEWKIMQRHTEFGARILGSSETTLFQAAETIALTHHERWDGTGYPYGLAGEEIPLYGRICAIADVFDAMTSDRPYKSAWPPALARDVISQEFGRHFDPQLEGPFKECYPQFVRIREHLSDRRQLRF
ncbi:MAG: HD domain-containing phosphohydrolase [Desulfovibrionaceae bacterium]